MTREEAIKWLIKPTVTSTEVSPTKVKELEAYDMAIEALSADAEAKRVLQGYFKGANIIQTIRHEELTQIANTRKAVESADAVAVVRCKDCQYRKKVGTSYYCQLDEFNVQDADFCSWGERKEP